MFDNIGIVRYADLDPDTTVGREFIRTSPVEQTVLDDTVPLINYIWQRLYIEGLAVGVTALSNSDISASMDYSSRSTVRIYVAEDTTHAIEQAVAERHNLQRLDQTDYAVY